MEVLLIIRGEGMNAIYKNALPGELIYFVQPPRKPDGKYKFLRAFETGF